MAFEVVLEPVVVVEGAHAARAQLTLVDEVRLEEEASGHLLQAVCCVPVPG